MSHEVQLAARPPHGRPTRSVKNDKDRWIAKLFTEHEPGVVESALMRHDIQIPMGSGQISRRG
jgi:hypothetical protein